MKKTLIIKSIIAILIVLSVGFATVSCDIIDGIINDGEDGVTSVDKTALNAEIAFEVADLPDCTPDTSDAYSKKLIEAKAIADDETATQEAVDKVLAELVEARNALTLRVVEAVDPIDRTIRIVSGNTRKIFVSEYVNSNSLSNITYSVKTSNAVAELGSVVDGAFIVTAGEVIDRTEVTVTITAYYKAEA